MSKLEVDAIEPQSGTTITIGSSGDTVNLVGTLNSNGSPLPGDISSVVAGTGLSGGGTTGAVTLNIDSAQPTITSLGTLTSATISGNLTVDTNTLIIDSSLNNVTFNVNGFTVNGSSFDINTIIYPDGIAMADSRAISFGTDSDFELSHSLSGDDILKLNLKASDNHFAIYDSSTELVRFTGSGKVGIGTTSPGYPLQINSSAQTTLLHLNSTAGTSSAITFANTGSNDSIAISAESDDLKLRTDDGNILFAVAENSEKMRISSAGKVLVNTTGEYAGTGAEMTVNDGIDVGTTSTANGGFVSFVGDGVGQIGEIGSKVSGYSTMPNIEFHADNVSGGSQAGHIEFNTKFSSGSRSEAVRITSEGFVGIGTTSPGSPLTVSHTNSTVAFLNNNVSATTDLQNLLLLQSNCSGSAGVGFGINIPFNGERNDGSTQRFGDFGFSANTNSGTSLKTDCIIKLMGGHEVLRLKQTNAGSQNEMIAPDLLTSGTTSNRYPLYWVHSGTVGSIQPYTGSVREMKTDINDMSSVNWIHSLRPRSFKFRDFETSEDGSKVYLDTTNNEPNTEYGLIAEEVNEVNGSDYILDKQIDEDGNENLKGVLYHNLVPVLLKAVQEQKNTIQELEARITELENA